MKSSWRDWAGIGSRTLLVLAGLVAGPLIFQMSGFSAFAFAIATKPELSEFEWKLLAFFLLNPLLIPGLLTLPATCIAFIWPNGDSLSAFALFTVPPALPFITIWAVLHGSKGIVEVYLRGTLFICFLVLIIVVAILMVPLHVPGRQDRKR